MSESGVHASHIPRCGARGALPARTLSSFLSSSPLQVGNHPPTHPPPSNGTLALVWPMRVSPSSGRGSHAACEGSPPGANAQELSAELSLPSRAPELRLRRGWSPRCPLPCCTSALLHVPLQELLNAPLLLELMTLLGLAPKVPELLFSCGLPLARCCSCCCGDGGCGGGCGCSCCWGGGCGLLG